MSKEIKSKFEIKGDLFGLLRELQEKGVHFTSGREIEMDENGKWRTKKVLF
jgi:hypothetical protein